MTKSRARKNAEPAGSPSTRRMDDTRLVWIVCLTLALITLLAFAQVFVADFTNFDDPDYVVSNPHVQDGLTAESLRWAFNAGYASNWHPLTWISHMLDIEVYGMEPAGHHFTNLLLHILNSVLLLLILKRLTGRLWESAFVAALFAVHPLHVESVAWVSERKDVLSTLFWMLTTGAYLLYLEKPGLKRYGAVAGLYALGLMAKPMLVTLPLTLLLLDFWPLRRFASLPEKGGRSKLQASVVLEKLPLLVLAAGSSVLTMIAQSRGGSVAVSELLPMPWRIENAVVQTAVYIGKMFLPLKLAAFYPHPEGALAAWQAAGSGLLIAGLTVGAIVLRRKHPYLIAGWFWYLLTLAPTIGIIQVGRQARADRYTYIPLIGLFIAITWGVTGLYRSAAARGVFSGTRRHLMAVPCFLIAALSVGTWAQTGHWRDDERLWRRALAVQPGWESHVAHYNIGAAMSKRGDSEGAIKEYRKALKINPKYAPARINLAGELQGQGKVDEIMQDTGDSMPESAELHYNIAAGLANQRRFAEAVKEYRKAIEINPDFVEAHTSLTVALYYSGDYAATWEQVRVCEQRGIQLPRGFRESLSRKMPEQ